MTGESGCKRESRSSRSLAGSGREAPTTHRHSEKRGLEGAESQGTPFLAQTPAHASWLKSLVPGSSFDEWPFASENGERDNPSRLAHSRACEKTTEQGSNRSNQTATCFSASVGMTR